MLVKEDSVNTRYQQEKRTSAFPVIPYWAVLGARKKQKRLNQNLIYVLTLIKRQLGVLERALALESDLSSHLVLLYDNMWPIPLIFLSFIFLKGKIDIT